MNNPQYLPANQPAMQQQPPPQQVNQPQTGQWAPVQPPVPPMAAPPRPPRQARPALLPALLLMLAAVITIVSTMLTITQKTERLLNPGSTWTGSKSQVEILTASGWSLTSSVPFPHMDMPLTGYGLALAGVIALLAGILLLVERERWSWLRPLTGLAAGLLAGVAVAAVLDALSDMSGDFTDKDESVTTSAGAGFWLLIIGFLIAIVTAFLAMVRNKRTPNPAPPQPPQQQHYAPQQPPQPQYSPQQPPQQQYSQPQYEAPQQPPQQYG
jgi:hypothetical protein